MALTTYTTATNIIGTLGTTPEDRVGMTDQQLKDKFDENAVNIAAFLNTLINELKATTAGKGASAIGIQDSGALITATTVEAALAELATSISTHTADLITDANGAHGLIAESGTFTPVLTDTASGSPTGYTSQVGTYYKVGKMVRVFIHIAISGVGTFAGSNEIRITGLPIAAKNSRGLGNVRYANVTLPSGKTQLIALVVDAGATLRIDGMGSAAGSNGIYSSALGATALLQIDLTYEAA